MGYVHAIKGTAVAFVIFVVAVFLIPGKGSSGMVEIVLTVSTFLFAILAGFFLTRLNQRYDQVRELIAAEDAHWLSFYKASEMFGKEVHDEMRELIDDYYVRMFDDESFHYYKQTIPYFLDVHNALNRSWEKNDRVTPYMVELLAMIEEKRNKVSVIAHERVKVGQWIILITLASIIVYCMFHLKEANVFSYITTVLLPTVLVLVLLIMRDLQRFRIGGELLAVESGQEIFDLLGKPRYYNHAYLDDKSTSIPAKVREYRLGLHDPGDAETEIEIRSREAQSPSCSLEHQEEMTR